MRTGIRPATASTTPGERVDRGGDGIQVARAVIRHEDSVRAVLDRERRVLGRQDPFQDDRHLRERANPVDAVPGERGIEDRRVDGAFVHVRDAARGAGQPFQVLALHAGRQAEAGPRLAIPAPDHRRVAGDEQRAAAGRLGALDQRLGEPAIRLHVELEPERLGGGPGDVFDRRGGKRAHAHHGMSRARAARRRDLSLGIGDLVVRGRRQQDRIFEALAEERRRGVELADVAQHPRLEPDRVEVRAVVAQRDFVAGASRDVLVGHRRQPLARQLLVVEQVDGRNVGRGAGRLAESGGPRQPRGRNHRQRGERFEEFPPCRHERDSNLFRGALPLGLPDTLSRAPLRRRAPFAWAHSLSLVRLPWC